MIHHADASGRTPSGLGRKRASGADMISHATTPMSAKMKKSAKMNEQREEMKIQALMSHKFDALHRHIEAASIAHTVGYLEMLIMWASEPRNGTVIPVKNVEEICGWPGEKGVLLEALLKSEWLESADEDTVRLCDFGKFAPDIVRNREFMRQYRAKKQGESAEPVHETPSDRQQFLFVEEQGSGANCAAGHYSSDFEAFWKAYPSKVGKGAAWRAWQKVRGRPPVKELIAAIEAQMTWRRWVRGYIPNPSTWLNQRRWEDEPEKKPEGMFDGSAEDRPIRF